MASTKNKKSFFEDPKASEGHLLDESRAATYSKIKWSESHIDLEGFKRGGSFLGGGMLYYGIVQASMSKLSVIIGSGAGFVPKIVAQAQRDMGARIKAITYYIDADIDVFNHKTGQNYGNPELDKVKLDSNLFLMRMRSSYAAKIFEKEGVKIDYLHIDGDHSVKGILEDWRYYHPLLTENAIVTFHDYSSLPDTKIALEIIKGQHPEIEFIVFPNSGAGICVAQLGGLTINNNINKSSQNKEVISYFGKKHQILMEEVFFPKEWKENVQFYENRISRLKKPEFIERYKKVGLFLDNKFEAALEIGGFPNSIVYFLNNTRNVSIVEKYATNQWMREVSLEGFRKELDLSIYPELNDINISGLGKYNLVILDFLLEYESKVGRAVIHNEVEKFFSVMVHSKKAVIGISDSVYSKEQFAFIKEVLNPNIVSVDILDCTESSDESYSPVSLQNTYFISGFTPTQDWQASEVIDKMVEIVMTGGSFGAPATL